MTRKQLRHKAVQRNPQMLRELATLESRYMPNKEKFNFLLIQILRPWSRCETLSQWHLPMRAALEVGAEKAPRFGVHFRVLVQVLRALQPGQSPSQAGRSLAAPVFWHIEHKVNT